MYIVYDASIWETKLVAHDHLKGEEELPVIHIPQSEFNNTVEVWYKGELYDVSRYTQVNDTIIATVYHDNNEEELIKVIAACFETNEELSNDGQVHLWKHRTVIPNGDKVLSTQQEMNFVRTGKDSHTFINLNETVVSYHYTVELPPPKCSC